MKPPMSFAVISFLLVLAAVAADNDEVVLDTDGNALEFGVQYFIQLVAGNGGGLCPASRDLLKIFTMQFCPLDVVQSLIPTEPGLPVTLSPEASDTTTNSIPLSTNLIIQFASQFPFPCGSKIWRVDHSSTLQMNFISTGGSEGGKESKFKIEKAEEGDGYRLAHSSTGENVGTRVIDFFQIRRLVLSEEPVVVVFKKVNQKTKPVSI